MEHKALEQIYPVGAQSLGRAISLLELLASGESASLAGLARLSELPKATVHRLLAALRHHGLVFLDDDSELYQLGPKILSWAEAMKDAKGLRRICRPILERLGTETAESVGLVERLNLDRVCIMSIPCSHELRVTVRIGSPRPMNIGAPGKAMLAHLPDVDVRKVLDFARATGAVTDSQDEVALAAELADIRSRGYASSVGESIAGVYSLAVPILDSQGCAHASLALYAPETRLTGEREAQWAEMFKNAAAELQDKLSPVSAAMDSKVSKNISIGENNEPQRGNKI